MRIFVSFPASLEAKNLIEKNILIVQSRFPGLPIRWVTSEQYHVTLEFFSDISEKQLSVLKTIIQQESANLPSFNFLTSRFALYPNNHRPQVLTIEMDESPGTSSVHFQKTLREKLLEHKILRENELHPWRPHITIGRFKKFSEEAKGLKDLRMEQFFWKVDRVAVNKSTLTENGPIHEILETFDLK